MNVAAGVCGLWFTVKIFHAVGSSVMAMPYAIMSKNMCQNIEYNTRYDSLSIDMTYMSVGTLYVGHLRLVKLLECFTISSQAMSSKYVHGLLFYRVVTWGGPMGQGVHIRQGTSPCFRNLGSVHPTRPPEGAVSTY
jgi:hypothetical protein